VNAILRRLLMLERQGGGTSSANRRCNWLT
jgi:hypothetical protein